MFAVLSAGGDDIDSRSVDAAVAHPREIFKAALLHNASNILVAHNHPSGDVSPSREDDDK